MLTTGVLQIPPSIARAVQTVVHQSSERKPLADDVSSLSLAGWVRGREVSRGHLVGSADVVYEPSEGP
jgi:hypothetical protein